MTRPLAVRRLLASVTVLLLAGGMGAAAARGPSPSPEPLAIFAASETTIFVTTTIAEPSTTTTLVDRAAQRKWVRTLEEDVAGVVEAITSVRAGGGVAEAPTVRAMFEAAAEESLRLQRRLDVVAEAAERLDRHIPRATRLGLDTSAHTKLASAVRVWERAQRRAAEPYPCRSVLPQGAGEWAPQRLGDFQPYVDCLASEVVPLAEGVAAAGQQLTEAVAALD